MRKVTRMMRVYTDSTRFALVSLAIFGGLASSSHAAFHFMQIEQIIGGVNGDTTAQAIQLRMTAGSQHSVAGSRVSAVDAAGGNQVVLQNMTTNLTGPSTTGRRILLATPNFSSYTNIPLVPDFVMTPIPTSYLAAGQVRFTGNTGSPIYWSISWGGGGFTGSTAGDFTNDADGNFGPPVNSALPSTSLQALLFDGPATDDSTTNLADYILTPGAAIFTNYAGTSFTLVAPEPDTGDFDDDGDVDGRDFLLWQRGESPDELSLGDLQLWQEQYGTSGLVAGVNAIPEPAGLVGFVLCGMGAMLRRCR
jgi:hypothetical protein